MDEKVFCGCGEEAGKSERNPTGYIHCQRCGEPLCEEHMEYGFDLLPRCGECHSKHTNQCDKCQGHIENTNCEYCDYC